MRPKSAWYLKVLTAFSAMVLGLIGTELLLRALEIPTFHKEHNSPPQFHFVRDRNTGGYIYVNKPASTITFQYDSNPRSYFRAGNSVDHITNSWGFRGAEFTPIKPPGALRLLFVGDSFTFGEGVHFEDIFSEVTAKLLPQRLQREGQKVESCNVGVGGYNTDNERFLMKSIAPDLLPDAVVLCYVLNDAEPPLFQMDPARGPVRTPREAYVAEGLDDSRPPQTLRYQSRLAQLIWRFQRAHELNRRTEAYYASLYSDDAKGWETTRNALHEMGAFCRHRNIPLVVMIFPLLHKLGSNYPFEEIHHMVAQEAEASGAVVLDLLPSFKGRRATDLWVHPTDQHPNEKAHRIAAEQLAAKLATIPSLSEVARKAAQTQTSP